jgi:hypothetical protein
VISSTAFVSIFNNTITTTRQSSLHVFNVHHHSYIKRQFIFNKADIEKTANTDFRSMRLQAVHRFKPRSSSNRPHTAYFCTRQHGSPTTHNKRMLKRLYSVVKALTSQKNLQICQKLLGHWHYRFSSDPWHGLLAHGYPWWRKLRFALKMGTCHTKLDTLRGVKLSMACLQCCPPP